MVVYLSQQTNDMNHIYSIVQLLIKGTATDLSVDEVKRCLKEGDKIDLFDPAMRLITAKAIKVNQEEGIYSPFLKGRIYG